MARRPTFLAEKVAGVKFSLDIRSYFVLWLNRSFHWGFVRDGVRGGKERQVLRAALTWCSLSVEVRLTLVQFAIGQAS